MSRFLAVLYGLAAYASFLAVFLYAIGFVAGIIVPKTIDDGVAASPATALVVDAALLGLFALQHSVMARSAFKRRWTRIVPRPVERSTYVLLASAVLGLLYWQWRPIPEVLWNIEGDAGRIALWAVAAAGWAMVLASTFIIDHFELFGLRQVLRHARGRELPAPAFKVASLYRHIRHPLMAGFIIAFWATPIMTTGHLLFAAATTAYILIAIRLEERDLVGFHGQDYIEYRRRVPMLVPLPARRAAARGDGEAGAGSGFVARRSGWRTDSESTEGSRAAAKP